MAGLDHDVAQNAGDSIEGGGFLGHRRQFLQACAASAAVGCLGKAAGAGQVEKRENLVAKQWKPDTPRYEGVREELQPKAAIADNGDVALEDGGALASVQEYPKGCVVKLRWTPESPGGTYADVLVIGTRTKAENRRQKWNYQLDSGAVVTLEAHAGKITVQTRAPGQPGVVHAEIPFAFETGKTYEVVVVDDGRVLSLKVVDPESKKEQSVSHAVGPIDENDDLNVFIGNREPVGGGKASKLSDLTIEGKE